MQQLLPIDVGREERPWYARGSAVAALLTYAFALAVALLTLAGLITPSWGIAVLLAALFLSVVLAAMGAAERKARIGEQERLVKQLVDLATQQERARPSGPNWSEPVQ